MENLEVVAAVMLRGDRVLAARRPEGKRQAGLWEFPGGKVEPGERPEDALAREIAEEMGCSIRVDGHLHTHAHTYDFGIVELAAYLCTVTVGEPAALEHAEVRWLAPAELWSVEWAPADIPAVRALEPLLAR